MKEWTRVGILSNSVIDSHRIAEQEGISDFHVVSQSTMGHTFDKVVIDMNLSRSRRGLEEECINCLWASGGNKKEIVYVRLNDKSVTKSESPDSYTP